MMLLRTVILANLALHCLGFYSDEFFNLKQYEFISFPDDECGSQLKALYDGLKSKNLWALRMIDSSAKLPAGIALGNIYNLGNFDECLAIDAPTVDGPIKGKYCLGSFDSINIFGNNMSTGLKQLIWPIQTNQNNHMVQAQIGVCVPSRCKAKEINKFLNIQIFRNSLFLDEAYCQTTDTAANITLGDIITIVIFIVLSSLLIISTAYDTYLYYSKSSCKYPILLTFSMVTNGKMLFTYTGNSKQITCLSGIRSLSLMWIILGHGFSKAALRPFSNYVEYFEWITKVWSMYVLQATLAVDTFFLLSGTLLIYVYLNSNKNLKVSNIPMYYFHRILRIIPALAPVILVHVTLFKHFGSGPLWPFSTFVYSDCGSTWWRILTFTTNVGEDVSCFIVSWYLTVDMQLFFLSPLILLPLRKYPRKTLVSVSLAIFVSIICSFWSSWYYGFGPFRGGSKEYMGKYYTATHTRASPWLIGVLLGYLLHHVHNRTIIFKMNIFLVLAFWGTSLIVMATCIWGGNDLLVDWADHKLENQFHIALVRPTWALMVAWVIFACTTGYSGPINTFLSLPLFQLLAKLGYSMYLLHTIILNIKSFSARSPIRETESREYQQFCSVYITTAFMSIIWMLTFESPIISIEKYIFRKRDKVSFIPKDRSEERI